MHSSAGSDQLSRRFGLSRFAGVGCVAAWTSNGRDPSMSLKTSFGKEFKIPEQIFRYYMSSSSTG